MRGISWTKLWYWLIGLTWSEIFLQVVLIMEQIKFELMQWYINDHIDSLSGIKNKVVYSIITSIDTQLDQIYRKRERRITKNIMNNFGSVYAFCLFCYHAIMKIVILESWYMNSFSQIFIIKWKHSLYVLYR